MQLMFDDVALYFSEEEWRNLGQSQRELYKEVMKENYANLLSLGLEMETPPVFQQIELWEKPDVPNIRVYDKSKLSSDTEIERPKQNTLRKTMPVDFLAVPTVANYVITKSGSPNENRTKKDVVDDCETPRPKKSLKDHPPKCLKCRGVFNCYCSLVNVNSKKQFVCVDCGKGYMQELHLIGHQRTHYRGLQYQCSLCEKSFKKISHLKKHQKTHQVIEYKCHSCPSAFQTSKDLKEHMAVHRKPKRCTKCGEKFDSDLQLILHVEEAHSRLLECSLCPQRFQYKKALVSHQREHVRNEIYKCHKCEKVYTRLIYFLKHAKVHSKDKGGDGDLQPKSPPKEPEAKKTNSKALTPNTQPLSNHNRVTDIIRWADGKDIPSKEDDSPRVGPSDSLLVMDPAKNQGQSLQRKKHLSDEDLAGLDVERLYRCKNCKKCFRHHRTLLRHGRSHSLVLVCHDCGQKFGKLLKLFMHRCKYERKRPYKCKYCEKAFSFRSLLHLHQHTHDSSKAGHGGTIPSKQPPIPFKETCPNTRKFTSPSSLLQKKSNGIQATENPSDVCTQDVIGISPTNLNKILKRPRQEIVACKDYVKRVCYRPSESRYTV
ncbi:uncharacterized protein LOC142652232 [Rhinoderma darwinii]|uniref:uncharacterized protein LOC142652232 n=1 Tax=Rhinoderma darwinii TaxID=43563 RepID=UPI003F665E2A